MISLDLVEIEIINWYTIIFSIEATNSWGHINIFAKGAGHAVAQLDVDYGVDYEPFKVHGFIVE